MNILITPYIVEQTIEAEKMASSYLAAIEELQGTVKLTAEKYGDLETRFEMDKVNWDREVEQKNKVIFSLREELANANVLLEKYSEVEMEEQVSALAPSATSARKMVQSDLSFTEIYSMYKSKEQELELVNKEREHLRNTMQAVVKEVIFCLSYFMTLLFIKFSSWKKGLLFLPKTKKL